MPHTFVIFGASGNLTSLKLIPALFRLHQKGRLPQPMQIVGFSRSEFSHEAWREALRESTEAQLKDRFDAVEWKAFAKTIFYHRGDIEQLEDFRKLREFL